ncbi:MAG TPA: site-2 protease family protein [Solirubrobacteraceae bacterium]|nr:site-2 protease family protein [Solirubrobacteraceae bacterium]
MSWVLAFLGFAALIILHEAGHFAAAKALGMRVERFSLFLGKPLVSVRRGETEYAIGPIPLGGYVKITGMNAREEIPPEVAHRAYFRQPAWKRIVVILAGPAVNVLLAFVILAALFWANGAPRPGVSVGVVEQGSPAEGQLQRGDMILAAEGVRIDSPQLTVEQTRARIERLTSIVGSRACPGSPREGCRAAMPVSLLVGQPGEEPRRVEISPRYDAELDRMLLGFAFGDALQPAGPLEASSESLATMWRVTALTAEVLAGLFYSAEARDMISGPVGNYEATRQAFTLDVALAIRLLGLISLSLAIINLLPFLPLDGGHVLWALVEKVRGRRIPFWVMERASFVGILLIIPLFALGLTNDLERIISGEGFGLR